MFILFFAVWVLLNGRLDGQIAAFGLLISAAVYWFCCRFMHYSPKRDWDTVKRLPRLLTFFCVMLREIFRSAFALLPYIYGLKEPDPAVVRFRADRLKTDMGRVFLANAITMTPGTITGDLDGEGVYLVHCLDRTMGEGLENSCFVEKLERWEAD